MRTFWFVIPFAFLLTCACSTDRKAARSESARLQGKWTVLDMEDSGEKVPAEVRLTLIEFADDKLFLSNAQSTQSNRIEMKFSINPSTMPKSLEIVAVTGDGSKVMMKGIYEFGEDQLRLCWNDSGHGRPKGFETNATTQGMSFQLMREDAVN